MSQEVPISSLVLHVVAPIDTTGSGLYERENVRGMIQWISNNRERFDTVLMPGFLTAINRANATLAGERPEDEYRNMQLLYDSLHDTDHTIFFPLPNEVSYFGFVRTFVEMNHLMSNGEADPPVVPSLRFNATKTDSMEALVVGAMFHFYEELIMRDPEIASRIPARDLIVDALVESAAQTGYRDPVVDAVRKEDRLNWVNGYEGFTTEFRQSLDCE